MKNSLITIAAVIAFNSLSLAQNSSTGSATDFRGFDWRSSMTKEELKSALPKL